MKQTYEMSYSKGAKKAILEYSFDKSDLEISADGYFEWEVPIEGRQPLKLYIQLDDNGTAVDAGFVRKIYDVAGTLGDEKKTLYVRVRWNA